MFRDIFWSIRVNLNYRGFECFISANFRLNSRRFVSVFLILCNFTRQGVVISYLYTIPWKKSGFYLVGSTDIRWNLVLKISHCISSVEMESENCKFPEPWLKSSFSIDGRGGLWNLKSYNNIRKARLAHHKYIHSLLHAYCRRVELFTK